MENKFVGRVVLGVALVAGAGCADVSTQTDGEFVENVNHGLTFTRHDASVLEGAFEGHDATIRFSARTVGKDRAELEFDVNGKILGYEAVAATRDHNGWFRIDADTVFETADIEGAQAALDALTDELGTDVTAMRLFEASVPKMAYFVANQAAGVAVDSFERREYSSLEARPKSLNDDGLVCIIKNTTLTAAYDKDKADTRTPTSGPYAGVAGGPPIGQYSESVVVGANWLKSDYNAGDYSCMGRCGGGCGGFGGGWTLDCLEHDVCSHNLGASGGGSDKNCGDEYNHAQSDIFSSCSGT